MSYFLIKYVFDVRMKIVGTRESNVGLFLKWLMVVDRAFALTAIYVDWKTFECLDAAIAVFALLDDIVTSSNDDMIIERPKVKYKSFNHPNITNL